MQKLIFGQGNAKLSKEIYTFSLPAGYTCPAAHLCQSYADRTSGKIRDGKHMAFRCFAASQESTFTNVRHARWHNFDMLAKVKNDAFAMASLILSSLDKSAKIVRIHVSGDYFNAAYFRAWAYVAMHRPQTKFYAYTKSVNIVADNLHMIPDNLVLTLSEGGRHDDMIEHLGIKSAKVVFSEDEALALSLEVDHDDSHAIEGNESFALLIHGVQPSGSDASSAIKALKANGTKFSYSKK
jgi:hypothetical protein